MRGRLAAFILERIRHVNRRQRTTPLRKQRLIGLQELASKLRRTGERLLLLQRKATKWTQPQC
jgi:hypothetical protein